MKLTASASTDYRKASPGIVQARCEAVVDLGIQPSDLYGDKHQLLISFEIDELRDDGQPFSLARRYTASLHKKAILNAHLSSWRGKQIKEGEDIDLTKLVGLPCQLQVMLNDNDNPVISTILPAGPGPHHEQVKTWEEPEWLQELVEAGMKRLAKLEQEKAAQAQAHPNPMPQAQAAQPVVDPQAPLKVQETTTEDMLSDEIPF